MALLPIGALVAVALLANRDPSPSGDGRASAKPSVGSSPQASSAPTTSPANPATTPGAAPGTPPAGYTLYRDPTGFSVAVPDGWQKTNQRGSNSDGQFDFVDPTNRGRFLRVGYTTSPKPDPVADWESQEGKLRAREPSYQRISIVAVPYRSYKAADWDFTIGSTRVKNRGFTTGAHGYAIYLSAPESQWGQSMKHFEVAAATFKPAG